MGTSGLKPTRSATGVSIGLTGGVASGKSTSLAMFAELGAQTFSADQCVHELYEMPEVKTVLHARFGASVFDERGDVDRRALAQLVFQDEAELRWLEAFIHPRVEHEICKLLAECAPGSVVVFEVPLLFDVSMETMFDLTVTIETARGERERRATVSNSGAEFADFDVRQLKSEERVAKADVAYVNDQGFDELRRFIGGVHRRALALAEQKIQWMLSQGEDECDE